MLGKKGEKIMPKRFVSVFQCEKKKYELEVKKYFEANGVTIMKKIHEGGYDIRTIKEDDLQQLLTEDFPKADWIESHNVAEQSRYLLAHMGYNFEYDAYGMLYLKEDIMYKTIVYNHLQLSGCNILNALSDYCQRTSGRISYDEMQEVLGKHYPKTIHVNVLDERLNVLLFLKTSGLLFKFDENYVYFP